MPGEESGIEGCGQRNAAQRAAHARHNPRRGQCSENPGDGEDSARMGLRKHDNNHTRRATARLRNTGTDDTWPNTQPNVHRPRRLDAYRRSEEQPTHHHPHHRQRRHHHASSPGRTLRPIRGGRHNGGACLDRRAMDIQGNECNTAHCPPSPWPRKWPC